MFISLSWIKDYVELGELSPENVMERVTISTAEVEGIEIIGKHFSQIKTAKVLKTKPHPDADKLKLVTVDDGAGTIEVVCGAPNVAEGQIVAFARIGAELPTGKLKAGKIRGIKSEGMVLAEDELGLSEDHDGIIVYPEDTEVGITLDKIYGDSDIVFEIENKSLTHRPDLWGHVGFAREFSAIYKKPFNWGTNENIIEKSGDVDPLKIDNQTTDLCPRYSGLVVKNVYVKPSPMWIQQRLRAVGVRPINNLVDVTNFVMLEMGQPMHAFDRRQIEGDVIVIRRANDNEEFTTLDEAEHKLFKNDIVIADANRAVALGGIMGGLNSEIEEDTTELVLESANFHATTIRRTASRLGMRTEASKRFEKGLDPVNTRASIIRAVELIRLTCPEARVASDFLDSWPVKPEKSEIEISFEYIHQRIGEKLSEELIVDILKRLQFDVQELDGGLLKIGVPTWRATGDIGIKADIVEEIGRTYGYDNIIPVAPLVLSDPPKINNKRKFEWLVRDIFTSGLGFDEVYNYSFVSEKHMTKLGLDPEKCLKLKNPSSVEADRMRTDLITNLVQNIVTNQKQLDQFRIFEIGRTILKNDLNSKDLAEENFRVSGAIFGEGDTPFYSVKGAIQKFVEILGFKRFDLKRSKSVPSWAHPGRSVDLFIIGKFVGTITELHPGVAEEFDIKTRVGIFDLDFDVLFDLPRGTMKFTPLRKFPVNPIEITVVVDTRTPVGDIEDVIKKAGKKQLLKHKFLYLYEGDKMPEGKKAVTYHLVFGAKDKTLSHDEVQAIHERLVRALNKAGMPIRGEENKDS